MVNNEVEENVEGRQDVYLAAARKYKRHRGQYNLTSRF
jgi:hypothetical protein